ncbi:MAG: transporter permease, partial [Bacillales bacterium]|nr:transporter permease [Bacillales bacterium]
MNKFWLVTKHTFLTKVKSKQFLIATAVMILLTFGLSNMSRVAHYFDNNEGESIGVIASSEDFEKLKTFLKGNKEIKELLKFQSEVESEQAIKSETIKGYVTIGIENEQYHATFKTLSISNENQINVLYGAVSAINAQYQMVKLKIPSDTLAKINAPITFERISLEKNAKSQEELNQARGLVYALLFVIYISVLMYSNMIASEVASEKTSRIMEILIS